MLLAAAPLLASCDSLHELLALRRGLVSAFHVEAASVHRSTTSQASTLTVTLVNAAEADSSSQAAERLARAVAEYVRDHYGGYAALNRVVIELGHRSRVGPASVSSTARRYVFNRAMLDASVPVASTVPSAVRAVCDSVAAAWGTAHGVVVTRADTSAAVADESEAAPGCRVTAAAAQGVDRASRVAQYWATPQAGRWHEVVARMADGPDGYGRVYTREAVVCQVQVVQDGGDDGDSSYVPSPAVRETTVCQRGEGG